MIIFLLVLSFILLEIKAGGGGGSTSETTNTKNITGIDCYNNTHPEKPEDCFENFDKENSCCYAEITLHDGRNTTSCVKIKNKFDFIGSKLTKIEYNGTYEHANVICESDAHAQKNCGESNPKILADCRMDGGQSNSCCLFYNQENTATCLLSAYKFGQEQVYNFNNTVIQCNSLNLFMSSTILYIMLFLV
jgi:hypothetical protein